MLVHPTAYGEQRASPGACPWEALRNSPHLKLQTALDHFQSKPSELQAELKQPPPTQPTNSTLATKPPLARETSYLGTSPGTLQKR